MYVRQNEFKGVSRLNSAQLVSKKGLLLKSFYIALVWGLSLILSSWAFAAPAKECSAVLDTTETSFVKNLNRKAGLKLSAAELSAAASESIILTPEFQFIRDEAQRRGMRVWFFGGTAASYLHYVKWDLERSKGLKDLQGDRFDYDFTNIFRSTQDMDIVVDAPEKTAREFEMTLGARFPHFLGSKAKWEVRTLRVKMGTFGTPQYKEALLGDKDFYNQNSDSNSLGMVEITQSHEPVIRDLRHWDEATSPFLEDTLNSRISYFRSDKHFTTVRAKAGENPEIMSVVRLLVKAFQYELDFSPEDFKQMKSIIDAFKPKEITNANARRRLNDTAKKLVMHAVNIEYAFNKLDELGLRKKLIALGNPTDMDSASWWLSKEPLRSRPVGEGRGSTAKELGIDIVAHETGNFLAYESITRSHSGEPNVLISRENAVGEAAIHGDGFYTRIGTIGARGTGLTIRFKVDPNARRDKDFKLVDDYVIIKNKKALKVIQESLNFTVQDFMALAESSDGVKISTTDRGLLEKLKRRLHASMFNEQLDLMIQDRSIVGSQKLVRTLRAFEDIELIDMLSEQTADDIYKHLYTSARALSKSENDGDRSRSIEILSAAWKSLDHLGIHGVKKYLSQLDGLSTAKDASPRLQALAKSSLLRIQKEQALNVFFEADSPSEGLHNFIKKYHKTELFDVSELVNEMRSSKQFEKRKLIKYFDETLTHALKKGNTKELATMIPFFGINYKNVSGYSLLLLADYYDQKKIIDWLIQRPDFDLNATDDQGFSQLEQLKLLGKEKLVKEILKSRPEIKVRKFEVLERNKDGSPIVDFISFEPKKFLRKNGSQFSLTEITAPFAMMSVPTTQKLWQDVIILLTQAYPGEYNFLVEKPSSRKGKNFAVDSVSFYDVGNWITGLNRLSKIQDEKLQSTLAKLLPDHRPGDQYRLPQEVERAFVEANQGLAVGEYSVSAEETKELANFIRYKGSEDRAPVHEVGVKPPLMMSGRPMYDLFANVEEWVGPMVAVGANGIAPQIDVKKDWPAVYGMRSGVKDEWRYRLGPSENYHPNSRNESVGFRLVRSAR